MLHGYFNRDAPILMVIMDVKAVNHKMMNLGVKEASKLHQEEKIYGERAGKIIIS